MIKPIIGKVTSIFPDDINTDDIVPAWCLQESKDRKYFAQYAMKQYDDGAFVERCKTADVNIIIAGENFGSGSSREQAVYAIQENNVPVVIAKSYPDIFYRNALNNGFVPILIDDISVFKIGDNLTIDFEKFEIKGGSEIVKFEMSVEDLQTLAVAETLQETKDHLVEIIKSGEVVKTHQYINNKIENSNPQTIVEKIISAHVNKEVYAGENIKRLPIDVLYLNEVIAPPTLDMFDEEYSEVFEENNVVERVFNPNQIFMIPDHSVPSCSIAVSEGITQMEVFAKKHGIKAYKEGDGIEHIIMIEDGHIVPGSIVVATDSHTDTNGGLNCLGFGIGTTDAMFSLANGHIYNFAVPETIRVNLSGKFQDGVSGKDLMLHLAGQMGANGASKMILEFGGDGLIDLSVENRLTITNMGVELGARSAIFEYDDLTKEYLSKIDLQYDYQEYMPDENCKYIQVLEVNLSELEPTVAFPHKHSNATPISKIGDYMKYTQTVDKPNLQKVDNLQITDAFIGACTNGRYEDFVEAARILKGKKIHPNVSFVAIPASRKVLDKLLKTGVLKIFLDAGVNIESSNCGPCFGKHMGIIGRDAQMISSSSRNYVGRMGSSKGKVFLGSPITVAASAVAGKIVDPRDYI